MTSTGSSVRKTPLGTEIPRVIHQKYSDGMLTVAVLENIASIKAMNPGYKHVLWDDARAEAFVSQEYGPEVLATYLSIDPTYGAVRADLFRYLLIYKLGGIYLDLKSTTSRPLSESLEASDKFVLSGWDRDPRGNYSHFGDHRELDGIEHGEIQQWNIISVAGHPFLRAVVEEVLWRLRNYRPWQHGVGWRGALVTTGPIPYTLSITRLLKEQPYRRVQSNQELGLRFSYLGNPEAHKGPSHYSNNKRPLVIPKMTMRPLFFAFYVINRFVTSYKLKRLASSLTRFAKITDRRSIPY